MTNKIEKRYNNRGNKEKKKNGKGKYNMYSRKQTDAKLKILEKNAKIKFIVK